MTFLQIWLQSKQPVDRSTIVCGRHDDPVWGVAWRPATAAHALSFASISSDGFVALWIFHKGKLRWEVWRWLPCCVHCTGKQ